MTRVFGVLQNAPTLEHLKSVASSHCATMMADNGMQSNGQVVVDCDKISSLPPISITIAGKDLKLTAEQYIWKVSNIDWTGPESIV